MVHPFEHQFAPLRDAVEERGWAVEPLELADAGPWQPFAWRIISVWAPPDFRLVVAFETDPELLRAEAEKDILAILVHLGEQPQYLFERDGGDTIYIRPRFEEGLAEVVAAADRLRNEQSP